MKVCELLNEKHGVYTGVECTIREWIYEWMRYYFYSSDPISLIETKKARFVEEFAHSLRDFTDLGTSHIKGKVQTREIMYASYVINIILFAIIWGDKVYFLEEIAPLHTKTYSVLED